MQLVVRGFLVLFGLAFVLLGVFLGYGLAGEARANAARAAALQPVTVATLDTLASGDPVLLDGTLSTRNPARFGEFVAYIRQEFRGADSNGDDKWEVDEEILPPLLVEAGGAVQVANEGYELVGYHERWQEEGLNWSSRTQEGTKRYYGLVAGRPVMAIGQVGAGPEGNVVVAGLVYGGSRAEYIAMQEQSAGWLPWVGLALGVAGAGVMFLGLWVLRRWK